MNQNFRDTENFNVLGKRGNKLRPNLIHYIPDQLTLPLPTGYVGLRSGGKAQELNKPLQSTVTAPINRFIGGDEVCIIARMQLVDMRITADSVPQSMLVSLDFPLIISLSLGLVSLLSLVVSNLSFVSLMIPRHLIWDICPSSPIRLTTDWLLLPLIVSWIPYPVPSDRFTIRRSGTIVGVPRVGDSLIGHRPGLDTLVLVDELPLASAMVVVPFGNRVVVVGVLCYRLLSLRSVGRRILMLPEVSEHHCVSE